MRHSPEGQVEAYDRFGRVEVQSKIMRIIGLSLFSVALLAAVDVYLKDDSLVGSVQKQVRQIQPTRADRRFDEIGWAPSILAAEATAAKINRPIFLFTYNGNIDTGRC
jgi:hypothetical protein